MLLKRNTTNKPTKADFERAQNAKMALINRFIASKTNNEHAVAQS